MNAESVTSSTRLSRTLSSKLWWTKTTQVLLSFFSTLVSTQAQVANPRSGQQITSSIQYSTRDYWWSKQLIQEMGKAYEISVFYRKWCVGRAIGLNDKAGMTILFSYHKILGFETRNSSHFKKVCLEELKQRSGYDPQVSMILRVATFASRADHSPESSLSAMHLQFHLLDYLFDNPVNQWIEVTARSIMCFNPIWFTEHRVYELGIKTLKIYLNLAWKFYDENSIPYQDAYFNSRQRQSFRWCWSTSL